MSIQIRSAAPADAPALLAIYAPYVAHTAITFEYDVPAEAEFARRIAETLKRYPYLVAEEDGVLPHDGQRPLSHKGQHPVSREAGLPPCGGVPPVRL